MTWLRRNWRWTVPVGVVLAAVAAWLAFGFFGIQTLFGDDEVSEDGPVFSSGAAASGMPEDVIDDDTAEAIDAAMEDEGVPTEEPVAEDPAMPVDQPEVLTLVEGGFVDRSHPTEGRAVVLTDGTEQRFLRFEDFRTDNGPDLDVWLSAAPPDAPLDELAADFVELGPLKGNVGDQNYEIPPDLDLDRYTTVVIWCTRFGVAFGAAGLTPV